MWFSGKFKFDLLSFFFLCNRKMLTRLLPARCIAKNISQLRFHHDVINNRLNDHIKVVVVPHSEEAYCIRSTWSALWWSSLYRCQSSKIDLLCCWLWRQWGSLKGYRSPGMRTCWNIQYSWPYVWLLLRNHHFLYFFLFLLSLTILILEPTARETRGWKRNIPKSPFLDLNLKMYSFSFLFDFVNYIVKRNEH